MSKTARLVGLGTGTVQRLKLAVGSKTEEETAGGTGYVGVEEGEGGPELAYRFEDCGVSTMSQLAAWDRFYVIVGSAAGALIGLQFVVLMLIAARPPIPAADAGAAFATPTIVHFGAALPLSALMRVPWPTITFAAVPLRLVGFSGVVYALIVARRMRNQTAYRPEFEDWLFHLPITRPSSSCPPAALSQA